MSNRKRTKKELDKITDRELINEALINTQFVKDYMSKYKCELFSVCKSWECSSFI